MRTLGEVLSMTLNFLKEKNSSRSRRTAEELIGHALKLKRLDLYMQFDRPVVEAELEVLRALLKRAAKKEPVEYIIGSLAFYGCDIEIAPDVLIPRPETEILVDLACKQLKLQDLNGKTAWDLCTGSGCIGIAVKKVCPDITMVLSDISEAALAIAGRNAEKNDVQVELVLGDFLNPFASRKADIVFCNPPYITSKDYFILDSSVRDFEPRLALVAEDEGLAYYKKINEILPAHLNPGAKIFLELGKGQGNALLDLFSEPIWKSARVEKDWAGHDRFFFLEIE